MSRTRRVAPYAALLALLIVVAAVAVYFGRTRDADTPAGGPEPARQGAAATIAAGGSGATSSEAGSLAAAATPSGSEAEVPASRGESLRASEARPIDSAAPPSGAAARTTASRSGILLPAGGAALFGVVTDGEGVELSGVKIRLVDSAGGFMQMIRNADDDGARATTRSDESGAYEFEHVRPGNFVVSFSDGEHKDGVRSLRLREGQSQRLDLQLEEGRVLAGFVKEGEGAPLAGIVVSTAWPERTSTTGEDGSFELRGLEGRGAEVKAVDPGGRYGTVRKRARARNKPVELVMEAAGRVTGRLVLLGTDEPVTSARVSVRPRTGGAGMMEMLFGGRRTDDLDTITDGAGRFEVGGLTKGTYRVYGQAEELAPGTADVQLDAGGTADVVIELGVGATIAGRVLAAGSRLPVEGAIVADVTDADASGSFPAEKVIEMRLEEARRSAGSEGTEVAGLTSVAVALSGPDGGYRLENVRPGARRVAAVHDGYLVKTRTADATDGERVLLDLELDAGGTIEGLVRAEDGEPIPGASLMAAQPMMSGRSVETDEAGAYEVKGLRAGTYIVMLQTPRSTEPVTPGRPEMKTVTVTEGGSVRADFGDEVTKVTITGTVTVERGSLPENVRVNAMVPGKGMLDMKRGRLQPNGRYSIEDLEPGDYVLVLQGFRQPVTLEDGVAEVVVDLVVPNLTVTGVVLASDGAPLNKVSIRATKRGEDPSMGIFRPSASTAEDGTFTVSGLDVGTYDFEATLSGYTSAETTAELSRELETPPLELRLAPGGTITGKVFGPDGQEVRNAVLVAEDQQGRLYGVGEESFGAAFGGSEPKVEGLPPGTYAVWALSTAYAFDRVTGVVVGSEAVSVEMGLSPGGQIHITCQEAGGTGVPGCEADLRHQGSPVPTTLFEAFFAPSRSGPDGLLRRDRLMAGFYEGVLTAPDGRTAPFAVQVRDEETAALTVTLPPPAE